MPLGLFTWSSILYCPEPSCGAFCTRQVLALNDGTGSFYCAIEFVYLVLHPLLCKTFQWRIWEIMVPIRQQQRYSLAYETARTHQYLRPDTACTIQCRRWLVHNNNVGSSLYTTSFETARMQQCRYQRNNVDIRDSLLETALTHQYLRCLVPYNVGGGSYTATISEASHM